VLPPEAELINIFRVNKELMRTRWACCGFSLEEEEDKCPCSGEEAGFILDVQKGKTYES